MDPLTFFLENIRKLKIILPHILWNQLTAIPTASAGVFPVDTQQFVKIESLQQVICIFEAFLTITNAN